MSPTKEGEFGFAPPEIETKPQDLQTALIFCFFFIKEKETDAQISAMKRKISDAGLLNEWPKRSSFGIGCYSASGSTFGIPTFLLLAQKKSSKRKRHSFRQCQRPPEIALFLTGPVNFFRIIVLYASRQKRRFPPSSGMPRGGRAFGLAL